MDIKLLTAWLRNRYSVLWTAKDAGQTSTEMALIAGALLLGAGLLVLAIRTKLLEKIGVISGG